MSEKTRNVMFLSFYCDLFWLQLAILNFNLCVCVCNLCVCVCCITEAVRRNHTTAKASCAETEHHVNEWLKFTAECDGGRHQRDRYSQDSASLPADAQSELEQNISQWLQCTPQCGICYCKYSVYFCRLSLIPCTVFYCVFQWCRYSSWSIVSLCVVRQ